MTKQEKAAELCGYAIPPMLFVTGTDTDAGKSYATGWLAREINAQGGNAITMKFVQTGNTGFSEDIEVHRRIMGISPMARDLDNTTAPEIFTYPCSPDLAARIDGRELDLARIDYAAKRLSAEFSTVIIEGAGGLMVPLKGNYLTADYVGDRKLPVVLVTNGKLGSINHTLLSLEIIKKRGLDLFAVIYNPHFDYDKIISDDTRNYIRRWIGENFNNALFLEMPGIL